MGHGGSITLWGRRQWSGSPYRRQRFRCVPPDGGTPHTFSLDRRQAGHGHPAGMSCLTCDITPGAAQGPPSRVRHLHTATEIAHLLQLVARGMSLRRASRTIRHEAHRRSLDGDGNRHYSPAFGLAARYLDLFGPAIDSALAPTTCPRIVILDSKPLNLRAYGAEDVRTGWNCAERGGVILLAMGASAPGEKPVPWRIGLAADETAASWKDFLFEVGGGEEPEWVVADGASAISGAVASAWPNAEFYNCEFHLGRALKKAAQADGIATDHAPNDVLFTRAFYSVADWGAVRAFATARSATRLGGWCAANDALVRQQLAMRDAHAGYPRGNGPAEHVLDWIEHRMGRSRRFSLRNAVRLQLVLALMRAHHAGQADLATLTSIIRRAMDEVPCDARLDWTAREDPSSELCSIGQLIVDAHDRATTGTATYMAAAQARSVIAKVASQNEDRRRSGLPTLVASVAPGRKVASVKVAGKMLAADFPEVARDWDHEGNDEPLDTVKAGSGIKAHWRCHACGHTWKAEVAQRTMRGTGCERCRTRRADETNSLAAVHPELVPEWDTETNAPLRPERIKATYAKTVSWICPADPEHPPYRMSPFARAKHAIGCRLCRKRHATSGRREGPPDTS